MLGISATTDRTSGSLAILGSMTDLSVALAGGAIGSALTAVLAQVGKARIAWAEVRLHDDEAREYNAQLVAWVDDETRKLVAEMSLVTNDHNSRGSLYSSIHGGDLADRKAGALHRFRDQEWRVRLELARLRATEGSWHLIIRRLWRRPAPELTAREAVEPFLDRWREPVTRHGTQPTDAANVFDPTTRTNEQALAELPKLSLT